MLSYPIVLTPDSNGTLLVTFPDVPEAITVGESEEDARAQALDALEAAFEIYFSEKRQIPMPSKPGRAQPTVTLPALVVSKVLLANEMLNQKVRKSDLAKRLKINQVQVDRLLKLNHSSKIEMVESAFAALGKRLEIRAV
ncbi:MAG: type II toxin-antitoxin system HicB family antitoxin [Paraburkholderia sp.]|uniref:type II toxin-antitoxin system HicB family antitoxin n=1 Tax=Paraburkholderia sp. TaxID=1926495 RepID=UPI0011FE321F|nr:type II toxin-antitoxin system HicB family antitoxin [Paraburkholderia sp.]TAM04148.1 MAG: type II toxin-antitoxin system HicB family antitoxin [Paraburkholderia sp.]TAM30902.1 MAG: type II toxin-antitoxin system HicB family antitoxin [Paraburkholderia sp.]